MKMDSIEVMVDRSIPTRTVNIIIGAVDCVDIAKAVDTLAMKTKLKIPRINQ